MRFSTLFVASALAALAACATTQSEDASTTPAGGRDCFRAEQASGYETIDDHNVRVRIGPSRSYTLHTSWNVNDLDWTQSLALHSDTGWVCTGNVFGSVEVTGGTMHRTYPIQTITRDPPPPGQEGS
jgi:hypothetical protein